MAIKPIVTKIKNVRGRITGYRASVESIEAEAPTEKEAIDACERAVIAARLRLDHGGTHGETWGHHWSVWPTVSGWAYALDTFQDRYQIDRPANETREAACDAAIVHLGQNVWEHTVNDDTFLSFAPASARSALAQWIAFQRAYIAAPSTATPTEKHRWACEHDDEFKVSAA